MPRLPPTGVCRTASAAAPGTEMGGGFRSDGCGCGWMDLDIDGVGLRPDGGELALLPHPASGIYRAYVRMCVRARTGSSPQHPARCIDISYIP